MLSDTSYKTHSLRKKPTPFMGGSISQQTVSFIKVKIILKKEKNENDRRKL